MAYEEGKYGITWRPRPTTVIDESHRQPVSSTEANDAGLPTQSPENATKGEPASRGGRPIVYGGDK
jgi:hypothetical protein